MFWYLHPFKTCKSVPISLKHIRLGAQHIRLGANQVPHSLYPNHRVESESKTYLYHGTTQTFARAGAGWIFSNHRPGRRSEAGKHLWHRSAASRPVAAERRLPLVANEPPASGKELPAAAWTELFPGLRSPCNKLQAILLVARAPVVVQETAARTAAAAGRMAVLSDASRPKGTGRRSSRYAFRWTLCALVHRA